MPFLPLQLHMTASVFSLVLCLVLSLLVAVTSGRELASPHQVKSQSPQGNTIKNAIRVSERPALPGLSNVAQPDTILGKKNVQYAVMMSDEPDYFYGAKGTFSVYGLPVVEEGHTSSSLIWVTNYDFHNMTSGNVVEAGWHVHPSLYKDNHTHLFASWTRDNYQTTGCYNLDCPGFVLNKDQPRKPGDVITSLSNNSAGIEHVITIRIHKEDSDGNWWLYFAEDGGSETAVGYWPMDLFDRLRDKCNFIEFGGVVEYPLGHTAPPMGSGHFSGDWTMSEAASFRDLGFLYKGSDYDDVVPEVVRGYASRNDCYDLDEHQDNFSNVHFYYGGPPGCPSE